MNFQENNIPICYIHENYCVSILYCKRWERIFLFELLERSKDKHIEINLDNSSGLDSISLIILTSDNLLNDNWKMVYTCNAHVLISKEICKDISRQKYLISKTGFFQRLN